MEYAGWGIKKVNLPESPGNGPKGKKVVYLQPGTRHPYFPAFAEGLSKIAERYGVRLLTLTADMTMEGQSRQVSKAIREKPDLVILVPINIEACTSWVKEMHAQRIPIIVSNLMPKVEAHKYIISWCGPDDWGSFRILARHFAKSMGFEGGYVIVRHLPGTSCYYSRTYSVITELKKFAPKMKCLAMSPAGKEGEISAERTMNLVTGWIRRFGHGLQGIICPDDRTWLDGINEAIRKAGREDIIMVSAGNTQKGMQLVKEGKLHALTFQPAQADGALPMKIAADWFNGLAIEPVNNLPVNIITRENVDDFLLKKPEFSSVSLQLLTASILNGDETQVDKFFEDVYNTFVESELITPEFFRGFSIEVLSILIHLLRINDLDEQTLLSDFESLYKNLFNQKTPRKTLEWLCRISKDVIRTIMFEKRAESKIDRIIRYVNRNYSEQLSLKVLSCQFNLSSTYLGRLLHDAIGMSFTTYLNDLRLRKAEELLRFKTLKACQVAKRVGYSNVSYFYTLFKKYKGFYPSQLRIRA